MELFVSELLGTFLLIVLGAGVVANVVLNRTFGQNSGYIVITWGWAIAVFVAVFVTGNISGAHINPAVSIGLAVAGKFAWSLVPLYVAAQLLGAFLGAVCVWLHYRPHFNASDDADLKRAIFCTAPAIADTGANFFSELFGTFILVLAVLHLADPAVGLGSISALPVALLVLGIGLSLGGTTGYAINPARDLGPRIAHRLLPIRNKGGSNWSYAWIPVAAPLTGAVLAGLVYRLLHF